MPIKFLRQYSIYNPGDVVAFEKTAADRLVASGIAVHFTITERPTMATKMIRK